MDVKNMGDLDLAYLEGFVKACQDKGVEPESILESKEPVKEQPNFERRRKLMNILFMALTGSAIGANAGSLVNRDKPLRGAAAGAGVGAAAGAGTGALTNIIRNYLGFSAIGSPVTMPKGGPA